MSPQKPYRPCRFPRCPALASDSSGYCDTHKQQAQQQQDRERASSRQRGYTTQWEKARLVFLSEHPLCAECQRQDRITAASVVDHIKPHKVNQELFWDVTNWQSLCKPCHDLKTSKEGAFGNRQLLYPTH